MKHIFDYILDAFWYIGIFKGIGTLIIVSVAYGTLRQWKKRQQTGGMTFHPVFLHRYERLCYIGMILTLCNILGYIIWIVMVYRLIQRMNNETETLFYKGTYTPIWGIELSEHTNKSGEIEFFFMFWYGIGLTLYVLCCILDARFSTFSHQTVPNIFWHLLQHIGFLVKM